MNGVHPETSWKTTKWRDEAVKLTIYSVSSPVFASTTYVRVVSKGIGEFDSLCHGWKEAAIHGPRIAISFVGSYPDERTTDDTIILLDPAGVVSNDQKPTVSFPIDSFSIPRFIKFDYQLQHPCVWIAVDMMIDLSSRNSLIADKLADEDRSIDA